MAATRMNNDPARIALRLDQGAEQARWVFDVPGNGPRPCFMLDPHIIPQKWGGNLWTNSTDLQSSLMGLDKRLGRDIAGCQEQQTRFVPASVPVSYPTCEDLNTDQSRAVNPAWMLRDAAAPNPAAYTERTLDTFVPDETAFKSVSTRLESRNSRADKRFKQVIG
jgi:hypothetical protein